MKKRLPKVPMSFRVSSELKEIISEEAASKGMKTSDYLNQFLHSQFLNQNTADSKDSKKPLLKKKEDKKHFSEFNKRFKLESPHLLRSFISLPKLEYTKDNQLIVRINPHSKNEYLRYLTYFREEYGGSESEIIVAAIIAKSENARSISPKPFEYYLKKIQAKKRYKTSNQKKKSSKKEVIKYTFGLLILFILVRLWKWSKS